MEKLRLAGTNCGFLLIKNHFFVTKRHSQASDMVVMGLAAHKNKRVHERIWCGVNISSLFIGICDSKGILFLGQTDRSELSDEEEVRAVTL